MIRLSITKNIYLRFFLLRWPKIRSTLRPSSAAVKRLFSFGGMLLAPKRRCMTDQTFEQRLLITCNRHVWHTESTALAWTSCVVKRCVVWEIYCFQQPWHCFSQWQMFLEIKWCKWVSEKSMKIWNLYGTDLLARRDTLGIHTLFQIFFFLKIFQNIWK